MTKYKTGGEVVTPEELTELERRLRDSFDSGAALAKDQKTFVNAVCKLPVSEDFKNDMRSDFEFFYGEKL